MCDAVHNLLNRSLPRCTHTRIVSVAFRFGSFGGGGTREITPFRMRFSRIIRGKLANTRAPDPQHAVSQCQCAEIVCTYYMRAHTSSGRVENNARVVSVRENWSGNLVIYMRLYHICAMLQTRLTTI